MRGKSGGSGPLPPPPCGEGRRAKRAGGIFAGVPNKKLEQYIVAWSGKGPNGVRGARRRQAKPRRVEPGGDSEEKGEGRELRGMVNRSSRAGKKKTWKACSST